MTQKDNELITVTTVESQKADKQRHVSGGKEQPERIRVHRSMYLERDSYDRLNEAYKTTTHRLYPLEVRKATFMEACIAFALDHLSDIEANLQKDRQ